MEREPVNRRMAAILAADVAGYSRLMGADEEGTLARLKAHRRELVDPKIAAHHGRIVKTTGDGLLVEFGSVVDAVRCAIDVQRGMTERNADEPKDSRIEIRIGINLGDIIVDPDDIHGDGVNIAARLEALAEPGGICISQTVLDHARGKVAFDVEDGGAQALKNIAQPVHIYRVLSGGIRRPAMPQMSARALALPDKPSIAVLPFQNMSGEREQEYFADGMVEEIITALSRVKWFFVIARNSSFAYKGRAVDVKQVARELGVRYVLEGSVRKAGDRVRIAGQLIDAATGNHIWADRFDGTLEKVFELQDRITASVVGAIEPTIRLTEVERAKRKRPESLDAYDCVMQALPAVWSLEPDLKSASLALLERAMEIDPRYALPKALAAWCHAQQVTYHGTAKVDQERGEALRLAEEAARLDSDDPMVLTVLGAAYTLARKFTPAAHLLEKALLLDPNSAWAWQRSGWLNLYLDRPEVAIEHFNRGIRISPLDPLNFNAFFGIGGAHFSAARYDEAVASAQKAILMRPSAVFIYRLLAPALAHLGRIDEARQAVKALLQAYPDATIARIVETNPNTVPHFVDRYADGLRKAGLPE